MAKVFLDAGDTYTVANSDTEVYGQTGDETISIAAGVTGVVLDQAVDNVTLDGNVADFTFLQEGINLLVYSGGVLMATIPVQADTDGTQLTFDDGTYGAEFGDGAVIEIGGAAVPDDEPGAVDPSEDPGDDDDDNPGEDFDLTIGSDLITGTDGDDTINGLVTTNPATGNLADTFQSVDIIDGGAGDDTLNVALASATAAVGPTISNVENIVFTGYVAQDFNMANTTGVTSLTNQGSIVAAKFTNMGASPDLTVKNVNNQQTSFEYSASVHTSLTDEANLTLNNVTNESKVTLTGANDIETLNVMSTGSASKVDLGGTAIDGTTKMVVTGDQNFSFDDTDAANAMAALKTLDASAFTGNLDADLRNGGAVNLMVSGGSGDDTLTFTNFTKDDVIDLGDGNDTLNIRVADALSVTTPASITNTENINYIVDTDGDGGEAYNFNMKDATELTKVMTGASAGAANTITLTNLAASVGTLQINGGGVAADTNLNTVAFGLMTTSGTSDELDVHVTNTDANGNLINTTKGTQLSGALTANGIETINVSTDQLHADTNATTQDGGLLMTLTADKLQTLNLDSDTLLDMDGSALAASVKTVNASDANGGVKLDLSLAEDATTVAGGATGSVSVTTGSGNDTVATILGKVATTVNTGAGNDTISLSAADIVKKVTIDSGAGNDSIDLSGDTSAIEKNITTGDGVDTIKIATGATAATQQTNVIVTDFTVGAGGDKIDMSTTAGLAIGGAGAVTDYVELAAPGSATIGGMTVYTGNDLATLDADGLVAAIGGAGVHTAADVYFVAASNGTDTAIFMVADNVVLDATGANAAASDTAITDQEVGLLVTLSGVSDASKLVVDNFTDFLA